ncbi:protein phosphatase 2C domain-containing protein [Aeoliella sp.]|uniref:protein phosphatase 2C domain-containing protein n=1 Tax=Aeoliella sp. TaxID=2795800 RepID=UPI003CCBF988
MNVPVSGVRYELLAMVNKRLAKLQRYLETVGMVHDPVGKVDVDDISLSIATHEGGKYMNQDAAALLIPKRSSNPIRWAAAIADGVSSSLYSDVASRLACIAALTAFAQLNRHSLGKCEPIARAQSELLAIGQQLLSEPEKYRPPRMPRCGWQRVLRDGCLLQTTLMVVWQQEHRLHINGVGDGGYLLRFDANSPPVSHLPGAEKRVICLGPYASLERADFRLDYSTWYTVDVFTDGVTPVSNALSEYTDRSSSAEAFLTRLDRDYEALINDNLTLFTASKAVP